MTKIIKCSLLLLVVVSLVNTQAYYEGCVENAGRNCSSSTNRTDFLLAMKKGGTDVLSTSTYLYDFFLCEEYNYDCGYVPQKDAFANIANGVSLDMTLTELADITTLTTTENKIKPYLGKQGDTAKCGMSIFPLLLTAAQSKEVLDGYMAILATNVTTYYNLDRNTSSTLAWSAININIRTAILEKLKANQTMIRNSTFWTYLCQNNFTQLSYQLKEYYMEAEQQIDLHAAYLIDSVTLKCNKEQSVNFLVDESGSIGSGPFQLAKDFLTMYVNSTNDDIAKMSIHFYDGNFDPYLDYGNNKSYVLSMIASKTYRAGSTLTGKAINATIDKIVAKGFKNGLPKVLVVMTDGVSYDSVLEAAKKARSNGIFSIAVGIGPNIDDAQLLQIAQISSNVIKISSYADLPKLVDFISNYFCKQIITIRINETYEGNYVRVPESPSYFRVEKSPEAEGQIYQLDISFETDPRLSDHGVDQSQIDPFPDQFTEYNTSEYYEVYDQAAVATAAAANPTLSQQVLGGQFFPRKVYFIKPEQTINYTVKKAMVSQMKAIVSYVAVRGISLGFNISLKACVTLKCEAQIAYYKSIYVKPKPVDFTIIVPQQEDLSIFIVIGSTLAVMACLCTLLILGFRKYNDDDQEKKNLNTENTLNENNPLNQNIETQQNIEVPPTTDKAPPVSHDKFRKSPGRCKKSSKQEHSDRSDSKKKNKSKERSKSKERKQSKERNKSKEHNKNNKSNKGNKSNKHNKSDKSDKSGSGSDSSN